MKCALVSMDPKITEKQKNIEKMKRYINSTESDLYIFGEMALTGYWCRDEYRLIAEDLHGPSLKELQKTAQKKECALIFGMPLRHEKTKGIIYNASIFIHPDGTIQHYKKWFLPNFGPFEEKLFFDEGERIEVIHTPFGTIGLLICYDVFFPELSKAYSLQSADILIAISASPSTTRIYFERVLPARAIENTAFVLYCNLVGTQDNLVFWGGSQAYDPFGNQIIKAPYFKESIVTCELDLDQIEIARAHRPVLRDTRAEIYQDLYEYARFQE